MCISRSGVSYSLVDPVGSRIMTRLRSFCENCSFWAITGIRFVPVVITYCTVPSALEKSSCNPIRSFLNVRSETEYGSETEAKRMMGGGGGVRKPVFVVEVGYPVVG